MLLPKKLNIFLLIIKNVLLYLAILHYQGNMAYISHHSELSLSKNLSENILCYNLNDAQEAKAKNYKK